jgi:uncharacterized protein (DUF736 family)
VQPGRASQIGSRQGRDGATLHNRKEFIMAIIGTFTAQTDGFGGTIRTLTLNVNVKFVPNTKSVENAPDYRVMAGDLEIGAAWLKMSKGDRRYLSVSIDDRLLLPRSTQTW